jgi:hypothetical protein
LVGREEAVVAVAALGLVARWAAPPQPVRTQAIVARVGRITGGRSRCMG